MSLFIGILLCCALNVLTEYEIEFSVLFIFQHILKFLSSFHGHFLALISSDPIGILLNSSIVFTNYK